MIFEFINLFANVDLMDLANAGFELFGSLFVLNHARVLHKDKMVRGVSVLSSLFFLAWGTFNIFYYSHLNQPFSWYAGICMTITHVIYVSMLCFYRRKEFLLNKHQHIVI